MQQQQRQRQQRRKPLHDRLLLPVHHQHRGHPFSSRGRDMPRQPSAEMLTMKILSRAVVRSRQH